MRLTAAEITELLSGSLHGSPETSVDDGCSLKQSHEGKISFLSDGRDLKNLETTSASIVIVPEQCDLSELKTTSLTLIAVSDPFSAFLELLPKFRGNYNYHLSGIDPTAIIDESATLGQDVTVGAYAKIAAGCQIGDGCEIHSGVSLAPNVVLGNNVILHPNVVIYAGCDIAQRVIIHANAVIGADGFGYQFSEGAYHKIQHFGIVVIEEDVEIGACTTIDRGMIDNTIIHKGTKIDNLVMVAHNCDIGPNNILVSQVGFAGSITTGENCRFGGHVGIADHVNVGKNSSLIAKAGVFRDIPEDAVMGGAPALPIQEQKRIWMAQSKLPEMRQTVRKLQKQVAALQEQISNPSENNKVEKAA